MTTAENGSPRAEADCIRDALALITTFAVSGEVLADDFLAVWEHAAQHPPRDLAWALAGLAASSLRYAEAGVNLPREEILRQMAAALNDVAAEE